MGLLTTGLPTAIRIGAKEYEINADYQTVIEIIIAFEDKELTDTEKAFILLELLYKEKPDNIQEAIRLGSKFLDCGQEQQESDTQGTASRKYSFKYDERYIYSGVDRVLNGRLSKGDFVHWWEFVMAFMELPEDCIMSRIIYMRSQHEKGKLSKEEMQMYHQNKSIFQLPEQLSSDEEERLREFEDRLSGI